VPEVSRGSHLALARRQGSQACRWAGMIVAVVVVVVVVDGAGTGMGDVAFFVVVL